jgi:hypothetical protein
LAGQNAIRSQIHSERRRIHIADQRSTGKERESKNAFLVRYQARHDLGLDVEKPKKAKKNTHTTHTPNKYYRKLRHTGVGPNHSPAFDLYLVCAKPTTKCSEYGVDTASTESRNHPSTYKVRTE